MNCHQAEEKGSRNYRKSIPGKEKNETQKQDEESTDKRKENDQRENKRKRK